MNSKPLAEEAIKVFLFVDPFLFITDATLQRTRAGELLVTPKQSEAEWYRWLEGIQDWCISRQLWWGHRCPAYYVKIEGKEHDVRQIPCETPIHLFIRRWLVFNVEHG